MALLCKKGFTLVELLVSISIFVVITSLLLINSGGFNSAVILTNMAYDAAITIREAQNYALSVRPMESGSNKFAGTYGVYFSEDSTNENNTTFYLFEDTDGDKLFNSTIDKVINTRKLKRGNYIYDVCVALTSNSSCNTPASLGVSLVFKRPSPIVIIDGSLGSAYAKITISNSDHTEDREVWVRQNGQIEIVE